MKDITKEKLMEVIDKIDYDMDFRKDSEEKLVVNTLEGLKDNFEDASDFKAKCFNELKPLYENIPDSVKYLDGLIEATEGMKLKAIENGAWIGDFDVQTEKMQLKFLDKNYNGKTYEKGDTSFTLGLHAIKKPTEAVQLKILEYANNSLKYIDNPTEKVVITALDNLIANGDLEATPNNMIKASTWFLENGRRDYNNLDKLVENVETISSLKPECRDTYIKNMNEIETKDLKMFTELYETKFKDTFEDRLIEKNKDKEKIDYINDDEKYENEDNDCENYDDYNYDDIE